MPKRRTKKEIQKQESQIYSDVCDALSYINFTEEDEIKSQVNAYRINYTNLEKVTLSQVRKTLNTMMTEGLVKKRRENYKYVN
mgnify:FL=1|tara:strand:+ start:374 stop:622 length:249 start_codon:yes stop_codon:yes gene_type:complete